jgi:hypothetical protein
MKRSRTARMILRLGLSLAVAGLPFVMTACVGYVQRDGSGVVVAEPEMFLWGGYGGYYGGYGERGFESRGGRR